MDLKELFIKAAEIGEMPKVRIDKPVRHSELTEGTVTQIRPTGIAVRFPDMNYDTWFHFEKQDDKRSKYTDCLELCDGTTSIEESVLPISDVSGSLPSEEEIREPIQNALYATGNFLTDQCTELATGILEYLTDAGYIVVRQ